MTIFDDYGDLDWLSAAAAAIVISGETLYSSSLAASDGRYPSRQPHLRPSSAASSTARVQCQDAWPTGPRNRLRQASASSKP